ncbi:MAG: inositol monophosphatase family protein [Endomicrobiia bacterium]|nr:MAG: inositol monophosphatase family protein [Endomicrobiia bacterium]
MKFSSYTDTALLAAKKGASVLLKYYNSGILNVEYKGEVNPVTQADRNSQKKIIKEIKNIFPQHGILAEEGEINEIEIKKEYCWIIDPLDGTVNFVHSLPMFCISIGLKFKNEIISGIIYSPIMKEIFVAEKNKGAWLNGKKIRVSKTEDAIRALAVTGFPYYIKKDSMRVTRNFTNIMLKTQGIRRLGAAALDMAYVACGRFDFFWEEGLKPWDIAAGILIVKEAGGEISDYSGLDDSIVFKDTMLASNGSALHKAILQIISEKKL